MPSGAKRCFIHSQHREKRIWQIVGDADSLDVDEARPPARAMLAALRRGAETPSSDGDALYETVARTAFRCHERLWKAGTFGVNSSHVDDQILPRFRGCPIAEIDHADARRWFASLRAAPAAADHSLSVLSVITSGRTTATTPCRVSEVPHDEPVDEKTKLSVASTRFMGLMTEIPGRTGSRSMTRSAPDLKRSRKRWPNDPYRTEFRGIASLPLRAACTKCPPVGRIMLTSPPAG